MMKIHCVHIEAVVNIASGEGNGIREISEGWTKVKQVVHMQKPLSTSVKGEVGRQQPSLRYWTSEKTPHNAAEDGFTCDVCKVGISFPR